MWMENEGRMERKGQGRLDVGKGWKSGEERQAGTMREESGDGWRMRKDMKMKDKDDWMFGKDGKVERKGRQEQGGWNRDVDGE